MHRKRLLHLDDLEILQQYNAEIRGMYNYYRIANNVSVLDAFGYVMEYSMYKTFAAKYRSSISKTRQKYRIGKEFGMWYETKSGKKVIVFYNEGFRRQTDMATGAFDIVPATYSRAKTSGLITRLKAKKCEWCGAENVELEIHHVRRLKDLKGKVAWERAMIARSVRLWHCAFLAMTCYTQENWTDFWRAGYAETCTSGSEGGIWKPAAVMR